MSEAWKTKPRRLQSAMMASMDLGCVGAGGCGWGSDIEALQSNGGGMGRGDYTGRELRPARGPFERRPQKKTVSGQLASCQRWLGVEGRLQVARAGLDGARASLRASSSQVVKSSSGVWHGCAG